MQFPKTPSLPTTLAAASATLMLVASAGASAEPREYEADPNHLTIAFLVSHAGFANVLGRFLDAEGSFTFDEEGGTLSDLRIVVETESVFTNQEDRDNHLRSPDFLNSEEFPEMVFEGERVDKTGENTGKLHGTLSLLGEEQPLTLDFTWNRTGIHPFGGHYATGVSARGSFKRSDFGMTYAVENGGVGDEVALIIEMEAIRQ